MKAEPSDLTATPDPTTAKPRKTLEELIAEQGVAQRRNWCQFRFRQG